MTRISLVTPSFEQAELLRQNLANLRGLVPTIEQVVSDGGSTDDTLAVLREESERRPEALLVRSGPDRGVYHALNLGLQMASGDVLGWLNCDDLLLPFTIDVVTSIFAAHPDVDIVYGDCLEWTPPARWALVITPPPSGLRSFFRGGGVLPQPAVFFRRRVYEALGGLDESFTLAADHDFFARAIASGFQLHKVWELLAVQRQLAGRLCDRFQHKVEPERLRAAQAFGGRPRSGRRRADLVSVALHRLAIGTLLARGAGTSRGPAADAWSRTLDGRRFVAEPRSAGAALLSSTKRRSYMRLTREGREALFPAVDPGTLPPGVTGA